MTSPARILLVSDTLPIDDIGSHIIFRRHLQPLLERGWRLTVLSGAQRPEDCFWEHIQLPRRLWWWPPVRHRFLPSVRLRLRLCAAFLARQLPARNEPCLVLGNLWDNQCLLAAHLAATHCWPMGLFFHDDEIAWCGRSRFLEWKRHVVTTAATRIWSVSDALVAQLPKTLQARCGILRPLPTSRRRTPARWRETYASGPCIGYAGKTYGAFQKLLITLARQLQSVSGSLFVITDPANARLLDQCEPNFFTRPFLPADAALDAVQERCSALLVAYPLDYAGVETAWQALDSSFPSKLPEYSQTGLPLVLIARKATELEHWCLQKPESPFFSSFDTPLLIEHLGNLRQRSYWEQCAAWTRSLAAMEFDPARIQEMFEADLRTMLQNKSFPLDPPYSAISRFPGG